MNMCYKEKKSLEGLKGNEILSQRAINRYYSNPSHCKHCKELIKIRCSEVPNVAKRKKFCSMSCAASFNNTKSPKRKGKVYYCVKCSVKVGHRRKYCDSCFHAIFRDSNDITLKEVIYRKHHRSAAFSFVRYRAKTKLKKERDCRCQYCGYTNHVECCHIKAIASFDENVTLDVINDLENLLWLCPNHHWELEFGKNITLEDIEDSNFY